MSLQTLDPIDGDSGDPGVCIIKDVQYQFLPNLAAVYGDTCAVILQQFYYAGRDPYFKGERLVVKNFEGLDFVQMWGFMFYDTLDGIVKHLSRSTWYRYMGALKSAGAMRVESSLGERNLHSSRRNEEAVPSWYALNSPVVRLHTSAYQRAYDEAVTARRAQREEIWRNDQSAHWRPAPGEDTSKPLDSWRQLFCEDWPKEAMPKPKKHGGKRVKLLQSQLEIESVSEIIESQNAENGGVNAFQSQVEIGSVSHPFQSQVETVEQSQVETVEQSQVETPVNLNLRIAPYIDKTERSSKTESLDSTTKDTPMALSSAKADVVVENIHFLSEVASNEIENPATQLGLPEIMATLLPEPTGAAARLAARFRDAAESHGIDCEDEIAARVVARFPVAVWDEAHLKRLIGPDRAEIGLNAPVGGDERKALLADTDELRWRIFVWPGLRVEVEKYYARKNKPAPFTGAFLTKWREETAPERGWVMQLIDEARYALRGERQAMEQTRADAAWDALDGVQKRAFDEEVFRRVERSPGSVDANRTRVKRQLLNDSEFLASLAQGVPDPALEAQKMAAELAGADGGGVSEAAMLQPAEQNRCDLYEMRLRRALENGEIEESDLKREFDKLGCTPAMVKVLSRELRGVAAREKAA